MPYKFYKRQYPKSIKKINKKNSKIKSSIKLTKSEIEAVDESALEEKIVSSLKPYKICKSTN